MIRLLLAAIALAVLASACSANNSTPSPTATPAIIPTATLEPKASPVGAIPSARDVTMAQDGGMPQGAALLIGTAGFHHGGGGFFRLRKVWQLSSPGPMGSTEVIPWNGSPDPGGSSILGVAQSEDGKVLWMSRCEGAGNACYHEGTVPGRTTAFLRSLDDGASWQEVLRRDGAWWLRAAVGEKGYALSFDGAGAVLEVPSGQTVAVPTGSEGINDILPYQGKLEWVAQDGRSLLDAAGTAVVPFAIPATLVLTGEYANWTTPAESLSAWELGNGNSQARYIAIVKAGSPTPVALLRMAIGAGLSRWLDEDTLVLTADYPGGCPGSFPVLLSISSATAQFVTDGLGSCDSVGGQVVLAAWSALSGQVHTAGDCLNLRQRPEADAPVLECLADGVLLQVIGKDGVPAGWLPVTAPSGASGWVSDAFVARQ